MDAQDLSRPGIVTFKSTGSHTGVLWDVPSSLPEKCWRPTVPDLYRYSLTQNCVDVCLTGLTKREEIDVAIAGVQEGKLTTAEVEYMNLYGDLHRNQPKITEIPLEKLIYRS